MRHTSSFLFLVLNDVAKLKANQMKYILPFLLVPTFVFAEPVIPVEDRVASLLTGAQESCVIDGGVLELSGEEVVRYDFDKDGETDLTVLHEIDYKCSSSASLFQGTAGAVAHLMTKTDYSYGYARAVDVVNAFNNVPVILLGIHGMSCDEAGYINCVQAITVHEGRFVSP